MTLRITEINKICRRCKMPTMTMRESVFGLKYESCSTCHHTFGVMRVRAVIIKIPEPEPVMCYIGCVCEVCWPEINEV